MARLDRLGSAKELAQIGAAIGREFSHALLAAVARKPQVELDTARIRMVQHLVGGAGASSRQLRQPLHLGGIEIRHAPITDFPRVAQLAERLHRVGQRMGAGPVQQIQVDAVDAHPLQATFAGGDRPGRARSPASERPKHFGESNPGRAR